MSNNSRELTGREKQRIKKLVTSLCANYDKEYGCLYVFLCQHLLHLFYQQRTMQIFPQVCPAGRCRVGSRIHANTDHSLQTMRQAVPNGRKTGVLLTALCRRSSP